MFLTTFGAQEWLILAIEGKRAALVPHSAENYFQLYQQTQRYKLKDCFGNLIEVLSILTLNAVCSEGSHQGVALPLPVQVHYLEQV